MEENYRNLANAVIKLAAFDYKTALVRLRKHPHDAEFRQDKAELERFFRSGYFELLTDLDGEYLLQRIEEECG